MNVRLLMVGCMLLAFATGCIRLNDWKTGKDGKRDDAKALKLNETVDDWLNTRKGDHNDWRTFDLAKSGSVKITAAFDSWRKVKAYVVLRNAFGKKMKRITISQQLTQMGPYYLDKGTYFIQVGATSGKSVYSLKVRFKSSSGSNDPVNVPRPD